MASISQKSPFQWIWKAFLEGKYQLCFSTDILNEYAEIIERYFSAEDAENSLNQIMLCNNIVQIVLFFALTLIVKVWKRLF